FAKLGDVITAEMRQRAELEALKKLQQQEESVPQVVEGASASETPEDVDASIEISTSVEGVVEVENETEIKTET
ncbi:MAG: hypothetical protein U9Q75_02910, partial [Pseudomonadota bacterium]|nr:hypothetical protein [Pseudomonadota bacterium]